jgi:hypothetical protein
MDRATLGLASDDLRRKGLSTAPIERVLNALDGFVGWHGAFGETSFDHQSFYAGPFGRRAKTLYYRHRLLGTAAVAPLVFCEAFAPAARRFFHRPLRFPIADAHYAMGYGFLYETTGNPEDLTRAIHFLTKLKDTRCRGFKEYCWGYPFDWVTRNGIIRERTPLITTTPYVYEAFLHVLQAVDMGPQRIAAEQRGEWDQIAESIARHARMDIKDFKTSAAASTCSYTPFDGGGVVNAAAYRAFLLTNASKAFARDDYWEIAERNLNFVLDAQNSDGSWPYAVDGVRDFVDHFHTCFVMKALAKIHTLTGHRRCRAALSRGVEYYLANLFDDDGLPKPFARAPRLTIYKRELYDCAESINLCLLLQDRFPQLRTTLDTVVDEILSHWIKPDGSFRSRQLLIGWDNVPMHRWGQAQMFRSLAFYLREETRRADMRHEEHHVRRD